MFTMRSIILQVSPGNFKSIDRINLKVYKRKVNWERPMHQKTIILYTLRAPKMVSS